MQLFVPKRIYGPYIRKRDGRKHLCIVHIDGTKETVSYPKYIAECVLGRKLDPLKETIDHIDRDFRNDMPENIRIVSRSKHSKEDALTAIAVEATCVWCQQDFWVANVRSRRRSTSGPFCSPQCSGQYGARRCSIKIPRAPKVHLERAYNYPDKSTEFGFYFRDHPDLCKLWRYKKYLIDSLPIFRQERKRNRPKRRVKRRRKSTSVACKVCGQPTQTLRNSYCSYTCAGQQSRKTVHPTKEELRQLLETTTWTEIGRRFNVSDNAVRKWAKRYGLI